MCLVPATMRVVADADEKRVGNMMAQGAAKLILKDHGKDDEMPFFALPAINPNAGFIAPFWACRVVRDKEESNMMMKTRVAVIPQVSVVGQKAQADTERRVIVPVAVNHKAINEEDELVLFRPEPAAVKAQEPKRKALEITGFSGDCEAAPKRQGRPIK